MTVDETSVEKKYASILSNVREFKNSVVTVEKELKKRNILADDQNIQHAFKSIRATFKEHTESFLPYVEIQNLVDNATSLANSIDKFDDNYNGGTFFDVLKQRRIREAERKDMWILWIHRLIRWASGIILAIIMYSIIVWLSNQWHFIKVPVRDMFTEHLKQSQIP